MALKGRLTKADYDTLPEPLKGAYAEHGGEYVLDGFVEKEVHDEFRETNRRVKTELDAARTKLATYDGIDPAEYKRLQDQVKQLEKAPVKSGDELAAAIERATKPLRDDLDAIKKDRDDKQAKLEQQEYSTQVTETARKLGIQPDFMGDVLNRARDRGFRLADGQVRAYKGDEVLRGDDGKELTLERFVKDQPAAFFGQTRGSGGGPNARPAASSNGAKKILYDPTPLEMGRNHEGIAKGEIEVRRTT